MRQGYGKQLPSPGSFFQLNNLSCLDIIFNQKFSSKYQYMKILPRCVRCRLSQQRWAGFPSRDLKNLEPPWQITLPFCLVIPKKQSVKRLLCKTSSLSISQLVDHRCARGRQLNEQETHVVLYGESSYMGKDSQAPVAITPGNEGKKNQIKIYIIVIEGIQIFCLLCSTSFVKWCFALSI